MLFRSIPLSILTAAMVCAVPAARADQSGYLVACEPTEQSDIGRVVRQRIYDALAATKQYRKVYLKSKIITLDKARAAIPTAQLLEGFTVTLDTKSLDLAISGRAAGMACFALGELRIEAVLTLKNDSKITRSYSFPIQIPGVYSTKAKVTLPDSGS